MRKTASDLRQFWNGKDGDVDEKESPLWKESLFALYVG